ncbi:MAG: TetR/AcrR family transcriptional regulator [Eubacterium sp.]|nr:TetR/AcrR family transcriptional regulator [Eubacterium sp.]
MGKVEVNKRQKQATLLQAAFELFTNKGFAKTTISDIARESGLAKGTFYLYFKDKYDLRNKLTAHKAAQLFGQAHSALLQANVEGFENQMMFIMDYVIGQLQRQPALLQFISKNLSWGVFRTAFTQTMPEESDRFIDYYLKLMEDSHIRCRNPELMLFTIVELVGSTCYNCILLKQPVSMEEYRPYLHEAIHHILMIYTDTEKEKA